MKFKQYHTKREEELNEALISMALAIKVAKAIGGLLGAVITAFVKEMSPNDWRILRLFFVKWVDKILHNSKMKDAYNISDEEAKKLKAQIKKLDKELIGGEQLIVNMYLNRIERLEKKWKGSTPSGKDAGAIKEILYDFKNAYKQWEQENALEYKVN